MDMHLTHKTPSNNVLQKTKMWTVKGLVRKLPLLYLLNLIWAQLNQTLQ